VGSVWEKLIQHKHFAQLKTATTAFLIFILLLAIILIGVGSGGIQTLQGYDTILKVTIPAGVIVLGVFLLVSTILGLIGVSKHNGKLFAAYLFILFLLIICQFGVGGGGYTFRDQIPSQLEAAWRSSSDNDRNSVQQFYLCCGWWNSTDAAGSNCVNITANSTAPGYATTGFSTTGALQTTGAPTTAVPTTGIPTTGIPTTGIPTTGIPTTGIPTTGEAPSTVASSSVASSTVASSTAPPANETGVKRQIGDETNPYYITTGEPLPNNGDQSCGNMVIWSVQNALYYVASVGIAFAVIELVGLFVGIALAMWILVQAGKQKFNKLDEEELGEKFTREEFKGDKSDEEDDDGMSDPVPQGGDGKRKIVVNFGN